MKNSISRTRREAAANKKKTEANKQKYKKKQFRNAPAPLSKNFEIFNKSHQGYSGIRNNPKPQKVIFNISAQIEETETTVNFGQGLGNFRENRGNFNTPEVKRKQSFLEK